MPTIAIILQSVVEALIESGLESNSDQLVWQLSVPSFLRDPVKIGDVRAKELQLLPRDSQIWVPTTSLTTSF